MAALNVGIEAPFVNIKSEIYANNAWEVNSMEAVATFASESSTGVMLVLNRSFSRVKTATVV
jgi:hypothetical protein